MRQSWREIQARQRETEALAERLELRIHTFVLITTAIVLGMRLVAGARDLTLSDETVEAVSDSADIATLGL